MQQPSLRVLIAENQYLIAMEVERILAETLACEVVIVPLGQLEGALSAARFDVVVLDAASNESLNFSRGRMIEEAGAAPVFLSSYDRLPQGATSVAAYPLVTKPPHPEILARTVWNAVARKSSNGESLLDDG